MIANADSTVLIYSQEHMRVKAYKGRALDKYSSRGVIISHASAHACRRNGDSRLAGRRGADRAGPGRMAGGRAIQCGDRRRRALAVAIQRPAHSPRGGAGWTILHRDRRADGHARFRSHSPDVGSRWRRTCRPRYRFQRSPPQHQSDHCRGEGTAASSRSRRTRSREADPWSSRSYSTHRSPRPAGRLRTTPTLGPHMTHRSRLSALLLPFALLASTPRVEHTAEEQLRALLTTYETSLNAGDAARIEQLYAEDGVFMPAGFPTASGRPAVRGAYDAVFANIRIAIHFTVDELTVKGDVAYARTHSAGTATVVATGASGPEQNRELFVFARGKNGWKIARYMFNKTS